MIYRRVVARLRAQDWVAIAIEIGIVIVGVFIGTWVANWNEARIEQRDLNQIVDRLNDDVASRLRTAEGNRRYFQTSGAYARTAFAGWNHDPRVSDRDFAIAAYQASQITAFNSADQLYMTLLGGEQIRKMRDIPLRDAIIRVLNFNAEPISLQAIRSPYRDHVRAVLPDALQDAVRKHCGDRGGMPGRPTVLPPTCDAVIDPALAAKSAAALRAHPELVDQLNQHRAMIATYMFNVDQYALLLGDVARKLEARRAAP